MLSLSLMTFSSYTVFLKKHISLFLRTFIVGRSANAITLWFDAYMLYSMYLRNDYVQYLVNMFHVQLVPILFFNIFQLFEPKNFSDDLGEWQHAHNFAL